MFNKALIALDLSPSEQPVMDFLPELQDLGVTHLVLAHIIEFGITAGEAVECWKNVEAILQQCVHPLQKAGFSVEVKVFASEDTARDIVVLAQQCACDLIVIGSRSQDMFSKLFLGSVAREVIRQTTLPLLLQWLEPTAEATRAHCEDVCADMLRHVLFATDFSPYTAAAQKVVLQLASNASEVECVHVLQVVANATNEALAKEGIASVEKEIEAVGCKASGTLLNGKPATAIAHHAGTHDASLIVVGKHGQNWVESMVIGSTAAHICEIAGRPVLMVP